MRTAKRCGMSALVLAVGLLLVGPVAAGDILEETKARLAVEAQRVENLVREAEREAPRLYRSSPAEAAAKLQAALTALENDRALDPKRRDMLRRKVQNLMASYDVAPSNQGARIIGDQRRAEEERKRVEQQQISRLMTDILTLRREGKTADANRLQEDLARRFPDNPAVTAGRITGGRSDAIADNRYLNQERSKGYLGVQREIEKSARIATEDMEFPPDWKEKSIRRLKAQTPITEKERAILKALNTLFPAEFNDQTFQDVIKYLEKAAGVTIAIDEQALREANVTYDGSKVTFNVKKASLRAILHRVLGDLGLTYIVKDEAIQITSITRAKETLSIRKYYVGDLVAAAGNAGVTFNPVLTRLQSIAQINQLANLILQTVEPESWAVNDKGGLGTIAFDPITMSFVVRQTAEIHYLMGIAMR